MTSTTGIGDPKRGRRRAAALPQSVRHQQLALPPTGFLRLKHIVGDPEADPPIPALIPVCPATIYAWCKEGKFPRPVRAGRASLWPVEDVLEAIERLREGAL